MFKKRMSGINRLWGLAALSLCFIVLFAACSGNNEEGANQEQVNQPAPVEEKNEPAPTTPQSDPAEDVRNTPTTLSFYWAKNNVTEEKFMEQFGQAIQDKFPNYTLKWTVQENPDTIPNLILANEWDVDIFISSSGLTPQYLLHHELESDISDLIKKYDYDLTQLEPSLVEIQRQFAKGGIYGLPYDTTSGALFYNKELFERFGVSPPRDGMTWDEVYDLAKEMTREDNGEMVRGLAIQFQHMLVTNQYSAPHVDAAANKPAVMEDDFIKAFENLARFYKIPGNEFPGETHNSNGNFSAFQEQQIAMIVTLAGGVHNSLEDHFDWDVVQAPTLAEKPGVGLQQYPNYFYLTKNSENRDAAFLVMDYITSAEFQQLNMRQGIASVRNDALEYMDDFGKDAPFLEGKNLNAFFPERYADPTEQTVFQNAANYYTNMALNDYAGPAQVDLNTALSTAAEQIEGEIRAAAEE